MVSALDEVAGRRGAREKTGAEEMTLEHLVHSELSGVRPLRGLAGSRR